MIVAIMGCGGHGQDIAAIARSCGHDVRFYDDRPSSGHAPCSAVAHPFAIGVNDPATKRRLSAVGSTPAAPPLVHPTATVDPTALLGKGVVVGAGTYIGPHTVLDDHVHVGAGCTITRSTVLGCTTIAPGVDIAGDCTVGADVLIGVGARIANLMVVGQRSTVGAGAVVVDHVKAETVVAGVPAKRLVAS